MLVAGWFNSCLRTHWSETVFPARTKGIRYHWDWMIEWQEWHDQWWFYHAELGRTPIILTSTHFLLESRMSTAMHAESDDSNRAWVPWDPWLVGDGLRERGRVACPMENNHPLLPHSTGTLVLSHPCRIERRRRSDNWSGRFVVTQVPQVPKNICGATCLNMLLGG